MPDLIPYPVPSRGPLRDIEAHLHEGLLSARDADLLLKQGVPWRIVAPYVHALKWWNTQPIAVAHPPSLPWRIMAWGDTLHLEAPGESIWIDPGPSALLPDRPPDVILVTHAHYDHTASLGKLSQKHTKTNVVMSHETANLLSLRGRFDPLLQDCLNRRTTKLVMGEERKVGGVQIKLRPAGHLLGAATIEIQLESDTVLVTGDWVLRDVGGLVGAQWPEGKYTLVIMESTAVSLCYPVADPKTNRLPFLHQVADALEQGHTRLSVSTHAMGQAQELYAALALAQQAGAFPSLKVYLKGLAARVSEEYYRILTGRPGPWACPFETTNEAITENSLVIAGRDQTSEHDMAESADHTPGAYNVAWALNPTVYTHSSWGERLAWAASVPCHTLLLCPGKSASLFQTALAEIGRRVIALREDEPVTF